ncbi:MAG TPA: DUF87 domain-containing protein [Tenericutes bacterium]|jgi:ABC-type dipeptide/oligopeptide/nickel transport system ATPase component|nr:DUF87 domain-containing protein [Mycoplasmatota bacterium]
MDLVSELAPKGLRFFPNYFMIGDKYTTFLTVLTYPNYIQEGYLSGLTSVGNVKIIMRHIPVSTSNVARMLNKEINRLEVEMYDEKDVTKRERLLKELESLQQFVADLVRNQEKVFDLQLHLMITADTLDELNERKRQVRGMLEGMQMHSASLMFEQDSIFKSILPIFSKQSIEERIGTPVPSSTLAGMYPYVFDSIKDPGLSTLLGIDFSGGVILFNQFLYQIKKESGRNNANMIILGTSGSGKSATAKLLMRNYVRNGYKIVAIDPEGELEDMVHNFKGDFIDLGKGGEYGMINPLEIVPDADEEEGGGHAMMTKTLQTLKALMKYYQPDISEDILALFTESVVRTYKKFGITYETDVTKLRPEDFPTMSDVYKMVRGRLEQLRRKGVATNELDVLEKLELKLRPLVTELKYYFDGHTTIHPNSNFIVFNIRELLHADTNIRNALFFNILKYAWGLCLDRSINTVLSVDEAHVLLSGSNELGADFLAQVQRRARKYNTGTIIMTQQPSDFSDPKVITQGKAIFDNAAYYLIMNLKKQAAEDLAKLIDLNESEVSGIKRYGQGQGLLVCGNRRMQVSVILTEQELNSFGSGGGK